MWWQILFWVLLVPCLIILGIIYGTSKKLYKLFYVLATFTYVITIAYVIDVYNLDRNWILSLLTLSAILMILLGYQLTRKKEKPAKRPRSTRQNLAVLCALLVVMLLLIIVAALNLGAQRDVNVVASVSRASLVFSDATSDPQEFPTIANLTYRNAFLIPYVVPDQYFLACWYNSATQEYSSEQLQVMVNGQNTYGPSSESFEEVAAGETLQRRLAIGQQGVVPMGVKGEVNMSAQQEVLNAYQQYDFLVLVASTDPIPDCAAIEQQRAKSQLSLDEQIPLK